MLFQTASEIWIELHKFYEASSKIQLDNICSFSSLSFSNFSRSWVSHFIKLKNFCKEFNSGLQNKNEARLLELLLNCVILDTLPNECMPFKYNWLLSWQLNYVRIKENSKTTKKIPLLNRKLLKLKKKKEVSLHKYL